MMKADDTPFPLSSAAVSQEMLTDREQVKEKMMLGLRLTIEGIGRKSFFGQFGFTPEVCFPEEIQKLIQKELLTWDGDTLRLTRRGRLLGNQVFMEFVD
jgi:oxygen-independent coproporphyrinogen-3 oxidase